MIGYHKLLENYSFMRSILIGLSVFVLLTIIYWIIPIEITPKLTTYLQIMTLIIFIINGIVSIKTFKSQNEDRAKNLGIQYANLTQSKTSEIDKLFMSNPALERLYYQMYSHDPHIKKLIKMRKNIKVDHQVLKSEHLASNLIFQKMGDIYACEKLDEYTPESIEWINTFRGWMKSPILLSHWKSLKYEQHPQFRQFVENRLIKNNKFIQHPKRGRI